MTAIWCAWMVPPNASYLYQYISMLPGIQLNEAVAAAWDRIKTINSTYSTASMAAIAISYGHQDAADTLIDLLKNPPDRMSSSVNLRLTLLIHLDTTGSNEEIVAWYEANKENLVFDQESKKFKLKSGYTSLFQQSGGGDFQMPTRLICFKIENASL